MEEKQAAAQQHTPGSILYIGTYQGKRLPWRVLEQKGKVHLLLAEEILTQRPYHQRYIDVSWSRCSLRKWLNQELIREAFTFEERTRILNTRLENKANPKYQTNAGDKTVDKLYLLSLQELETYLPRREDRRLDCWWWLRSPGCNLLTAASVYEDGSVYDTGINVHYTDGGVRPAMWYRCQD